MVATLIGASAAIAEPCPGLFGTLFHNAPHEVSAEEASRRVQVAKAPLSRFLLTETSEGRAILAHIARVPQPSSASQATYAYRVFLEKAAARSESLPLSDLIERLRLADWHFSKFREGEKDGLAEVSRAASLSWHEKKALEAYAEKYLALEPEHGLLFENPAAVTSAKGALLEAESPPRSAPAHLQGEEAARWQATRFFKEMDECLKSMPKKQKMQDMRTMLLTQLGVNEAATVAGYVSGAGSLDKVDWVNLPIDMGVGAVATVADQYLGLGKGSLAARYIKMSAFGTGKAGLEGGFFLLSPYSETHGHDKVEVAKARTEYSAEWAYANSAVKLTLLNFFLGMRCMYPTMTMHYVNGGVQVVHRIGSSWGFFYLRNKRLESQGLGPGQAPSPRPSPLP